ncbi:MAG: hypothetical protein K9G48_12760 [Reyranella sp.]|nr:hypothetical protein [Reyranella sp.]
MRGNNTDLMDPRDAAEMHQAFSMAGSGGPLVGPTDGFAPTGAGVTIHDGIITARKVEVARDDSKVLLKIAAHAAVAGTDWFYRFPVKNKKTGAQDWIMGPSIKCANNVARLYGNCQVDTRVQDTGRTWIIYARFVDYETGFSYTRPFQQDKTASRMGGAGPEADARRLDIALQIGVSKAIRNVVCNALETFTDYAFEEAQKNLVGRVGKDLGRYKEKVKERLVSLEVDLKRVELSLGRTYDNWLAPEVAQLIAELQAINDGMATADETWPPPPPAEPKPGDFKPAAGGEGGPAAESQAAPAATAAPGPEASTAQPAADASTAQTDGTAGTTTVAAAADAKPAVDGTEKPKKDWSIPDNIVGQDKKLAAILAHLPKAETAAEVDEIWTAHEEFLDKKLGANKRSETQHKFGDRKIELAGGGGGE